MGRRWLHRVGSQTMNMNSRRGKVMVTNKRKDWHLGRSPTARIDLDGSDSPVEKVACDRPVEVLGAERTSSLPMPDMRRAMEVEANQIEAARYREWEREVMEKALGEQISPSGVQIVVRGGVRKVGGWQAPTQSMVFRLQEGETLDLRFALPRNTQRAEQGPGREGRDEGLDERAEEWRAE